MQNMCSFGCLHPSSATFSYYLRPERNLPGHPLKSPNTRLSVLDMMHPRSEVSSEQCSWCAPDRAVLENWASDGHGCHVNMSGESCCILGRALWESPRSAFLGLCLP